MSVNSGMSGNSAIISIYKFMLSQCFFSL